MSNIDWSATGAMLGGIGAIIGAAVVAWTAIYKAPKSYNDWKVRERFSADRKAALDILAAYHEGRLVIDAIRSPFSSGAENAAAEEIIEEADAPLGIPSKNDQRQRIVILTRIKSHDKYWQRVYGLLPVAKALFGDDAKDYLMDILKARQEVYAAAETYPGTKGKIRSQFEAKFWKGAQALAGEDVDRVDKLLDESEANLEALLRPKIE